MRRLRRSFKAESRRSGCWRFATRYAPQSAARCCYCSKMTTSHRAPAHWHFDSRYALISKATAINFFEAKFFDILSGIMKSSTIFQLFFNYFLFFFKPIKSCAKCKLFDHLANPPISDIYAVNLAPQTRDIFAIFFDPKGKPEGVFSLKSRA